MIVKENESLSKYTTFHMGGIAKKMYIPESTDELCSIIRDVPGIEHYLIGGGSNLLINDSRTYDNVLCLRNFNNKVEHLNDDMYKVGASVRLQNLINTINKDGYGGIEYLYSVPGLTGGAVFMNAGRGIRHSQCISDNIQAVTYFEGGLVHTISKQECQFEHRSSIFQSKPGAVILSIQFKFDVMPEEESTRLKKARIEFSRNHQDNSSYNFGSVFSNCSKPLMEMVRLKSSKGKTGCAFSSKTRNWLLNTPEGTFEQAIREIEKVEKAHMKLGLKCSREVIVWE